MSPTYHIYSQPCSSSVGQAQKPWRLHVRLGKVRIGFQINLVF